MYEWTTKRCNLTSEKFSLFDILNSFNVHLHWPSGHEDMSRRERNLRVRAIPNSGSPGTIDEKKRDKAYFFSVAIAQSTQEGNLILPVEFREFRVAGWVVMNKPKDKIFFLAAAEEFSKGAGFKCDMLSRA